MFERFTWELRATLLGNHARNARNARDAHDARDAGIIHTRTPTACPTNTTRATHTETAPASSHGDRGRGRGWLSGKARRRLLLDAASGQAGSVIAAIPVILLFQYLQKYIVSGLTAGGVKE